ncbi:hypothetical protein [Dyadobacter sp. NIV53]|uniref:hypothetical protein n=1 Tax=Dyadobacter sp. NIV53 TaxID=2861765 RepID=UPI001C87ECE1|nr:hypothetical protein [Dyadobacter sp. NIV53]
MKTHLPDLEKTLLLVMILAYGIVILIICWFSFDFVLQLYNHILSQTDTSLNRP